MKSIIAIAALVALSAPAFAHAPKCGPAKGNWVNAAKTTCPIVVFPNQGSQYVHPVKKPVVVPPTA